MSLEGLSELYKALDTIKENSTAVAEQAVLAGAEKIRKQAVLLAPVKSGELKQSIKTTSQKDGKTVKGIVYTNKAYAPYVEFGTGPIGQESDHSDVSPNVAVSYKQKGWSYHDAEGVWHHTKGQPAQPYMYPAARDTQDIAVKAVVNTFTKAIKKGLKK